MRFISKLKNHRLRYREKFKSPYHRQLLRLIRIGVKSPIQSCKNGILKVMVGLTYRCQCNCAHCCSGMYEKSEGSELATQELESLINQIDRMPSIFSVVSFFGGEPLLRKDIYHLIKLVTKNGLFCEVESNGILLSHKNVQKLKGAGLHHIFVSLDSPNAVRHDRLRRQEGCFENAINGIKDCIKEGLSCSISTYASKEIIHNGNLVKIINLGRKLKVTSIRILYPILTGNWLKAKDEKLSLEEEAVIRALLEPGFVYLESTYCYNETTTPKSCAALQKDFFYISPYGEIQPCPFVPLSFGNTRKRPLQENLNTMWQHPIFNDACYKIRDAL